MRPVHGRTYPAKRSSVFATDKAQAQRAFDALAKTPATFAHFAPDEPPFSIQHPPNIDTAGRAVIQSRLLQRPAAAPPDCPLS